jgi:glucosamine 6-phosphate synthetase-like amidotransferase/phosphosugar isomerase protein
MNENESSEMKLKRLLHSTTNFSTNTFSKHLENIIKLILFYDDQNEDNKLTRLSNINKESIKKIRQKIQDEMKDSDELPSYQKLSNKENKALNINQKIQCKITHTLNPKQLSSKIQRKPKQSFPMFN